MQADWKSFARNRDYKDHHVNCLKCHDDVQGAFKHGVCTPCRSIYTCPNRKEFSDSHNILDAVDADQYQALWSLRRQNMRHMREEKGAFYANLLASKTVNDYQNRHVGETSYEFTPMMWPIVIYILLMIFVAVQSLTLSENQ